ncbi:MAG TPA: ECF-type sigma factor, partial [Vicinamibacterales bacterium]|nr:ECF-type sigma factor [Vicinamibacterales bacterium]
MTRSDEVTRLLARWRQGDASAGDDVVQATYQELRRIARGMMRGERPQHTLQPTALVHEAYLRLFQDQPATLASRTAFLKLMASQMKRQLIDHARRRNADKRGGGQAHANVDDVDLPAALDDESPEQFLQRLDQALDQLAAEHPRVATIIRLRFLEDRSIEDTAKELGMSAGTVK